MKLFFKLFIIVFFISANVLAQENTALLCTNGVDDDGDGLIDCYDNDCSDLTICDGFFISTDADCNISPPLS